MNKEEAEMAVKFFTEIQKCPDKRAAFIKGVLYGLGFAKADTREPNWAIIEMLIEKGDDPSRWLKIEQDVIRIHKKLYQEHVELWNSL